MTHSNAIRRSVSPEELPDFTPVPRKCARHDGWTPERQRAFIEALADTGCVAVAARMVNMSKESAYQLRRQPGAASFRRAWDAAQTLGLQVCKDEAFDRAMNGQLVPVFVGGKLMGFRRKKNDGLLMFILRHYGQDSQGRKTTVNYFSTRATAGAATLNPPRNGGEERSLSGGQASTGARSLGDRSPEANGGGVGAAAEASTTTVKTVISGSGAPRNQLAADESAANILNAFEGVPLDEKAQAEIYRTLEACAERRRALEEDPENDPERFFIGQAETNGYLGELESGVEGDWVEYRPEGEHSWENLGEGGNAAEIDRVVSEIKARRAARTPEEVEAEEAEHKAEVQRMREERTLALPAPAQEPDLDDPRFDWRNWTDGGYAPPSDPPPDFRGSGGSDCSQQSEIEPGARSTCHWTAGNGQAAMSPGHGCAVRGAAHLPMVEGPSPGSGPISPRTGKPLKRYKKRTPKPAFTPPDEARKAEAVVAVEAERRAGASAEAERRRRRGRGG